MGSSSYWSDRTPSAGVTRDNGLVADTRIALPGNVNTPVGVFLNGVELKEGADFTVVGRELVVHRELVKEGELGFWRWFLGAWGVGTYRKNDIVDVRHEANGRTTVAHDLPFETPSVG